ncbi:MAG: SET domain-containing protein [Taibaiella sp.]|nr:SET domain-containing protein [Taibaiella sp.]
MKIQPNFRIYYPVRVAKSKIQGRGAYACSYIPSRRKIGSLAGEVISLREARRRVKALNGAPVNMVELWNGKALDASVNPNDMRFINHSCDPNTFMRVCGYQVEFYALRDIAEGEELSCNYGATHHDGKLPCKCGSDNCKGFL